MKTKTALDIFHRNVLKINMGRPSRLTSDFIESNAQHYCHTN